MVFENKKPDPMHVIQMVKRSVHEINHRALQLSRIISLTPTQVAPLLHGDPPRANQLKFNANAQIDESSSKVTTCIICRDKFEKVKTGTTSKIFLYSASAAEAIALREVDYLLDSLEANDVLFESDCMNLIETCRGNKSRRELQIIMKDVEEMAKYFNSMGFLWVNREGNRVPDHIAKMASKNLLHRN